MRHALVAAWLLGAFMPLAAAAQEAAAPAAPRTERALATEDVGRVIEELGSLRDYDRVRWILNAIEAQVPALRAELLQRFDDRVQALLAAEVQLRTASALASLRPMLSGDVGGAAIGGEAAATRPTGAPAAEPHAPTDLRTPLFPEESYEDLEAAILELPSDDTEQALEQRAKLARQLLGVKDAALRQQLHEQLQAQATASAAAEFTRRQAEMDAQLQSN